MNSGTYRDDVELEPIQLALHALEFSAHRAHLARVDALILHRLVVEIDGRLTDIHADNELRVGRDGA
jgi:hypothetical protein